LRKNLSSGPLLILKIEIFLFYFFFLLLKNEFLLYFMSFFYILDINPSSNIWFENIFFHSIGFLFILLIVSFAVGKLFLLM